jgi:hypothetical protein
LIVAINIILVLVLAWFLYRKISDSLIKKHFLFALCVKISAGIVLGLIYFRYYGTGDTWVFNEVASAVVNYYGYSFTSYVGLLFGDPAEILVESYPVLNDPRTTFFIKVVSIFYVLTSNNYWLTSIYFSIVSFLGSLILVNAINRYYNNLKLPAMLAFFYFPTFIFWTSGIIKEALAWFCLAVLVSFILTYLRNQKLSIKHIIISVLLIYILWSIKYYYAAVLILCSGPLVIYYFIQYRLKRDIKFYLILFGTFILLSVLLVISHPNFYPNRIFSVILENHVTIKQLSEPGHSIRFIDLSNPYLHFLVNVPVSLFGGLFMPLIWQGVNILAYITGLINTVLFLLFILKVFYLSSSKRRPLSIPDIAMVLYIIILAILLAYSTPNFGTLERYKTSYIGFFAMWVLYDNPLVIRIFRYFQQ